MIKKDIRQLKEYMKTENRAFMHLRLRKNSVIEYMEEFISKKKPNKKMLDNIKIIIIGAKTIYDDDKYVSVYSDLLYDNVLCKYKKFRDEPYGDGMTGVANVEYIYKTLAGTLDKTHYIWNEDKTDERDTLEEYFSNDQIKKYAKEGKLEIMVEDKYDGTSVSAEMVLRSKGKHLYFEAEKGISRGKKDLGLGVDVTNVFDGVVFDADTFPFELDKLGVQFEFMVSDYQRKRLEKETGNSFSNNRSAATGLLRKIVFSKSKEERKKLQSFMTLMPVGFELEDDDNTKYDYYELYNAISYTFMCGHPTISKTTHKTKKMNKKDTLKYIEKIYDKRIDKRNDLGYSIDGLVITILNDKLREKLGRKGHINQYQIAIKFPEQTEKTIVRDIIIGMGNSGYVSTLLKLDNVLLNGTNQDKGQLHSLDKFRNFKARIGDEVHLKLSGDVIPFVYRTGDCKKGDGKKIKLPTHCHICGKPLIEENNMLRCINMECKGRITGFINAFLSQLNVKGIGSSTVEKMYDSLDLRHPLELFDLTKSQIMTLDKIGDDSSDNIIDAIKDLTRTKRRESSIMASLHIDNLRNSTSKKILKKYDIKDLIKLMNDTDKRKLISNLESVDGIDTNAKIFADGLIEKRDMLIDLIEIMKPAKDKFGTIKVLLSGTRNNDNDLIPIAEANDMELKNSGKKFDMLIIKDESYKSKGKYKDALKLVGKDNIYTKAEFMEKFKI